MFTRRFLDESLRWLLANGKLEKAEIVLRKAAKWNKKQYHDVISNVKSKITHEEKLPLALQYGKENISDKEPRNIVQSENNAPDGIVSNSEHDMVKTKPELEPTKTGGIKRYTILSICQHRRMLLMSVVMWFTWCVFQNHIRKDKSYNRKTWTFEIMLNIQL